MELKDINSKIILSNSLTTGRRFVKKSNLNGIPLANFSLYTIDSLIKEKLLALHPELRLISSNESAYYFLLLIQKNDYGLKKYVSSFGAASTLLNVLNDYRYASNLKFTHLIKADYEKLVRDYIEELNKNNLVDNILALTLLYGNKQEEDCYILYDVSLRPLEKEVLTSMFDHISYIEDKEHDYEVEEVFDCYGQYNEVANVLRVVNENNIPLGDVEVLYTASIYENIIKGLCSSRGINYALKSNHAKSTNYVSFIADILNYFKADYKYDLLENILFNPGLDSVYLQEFYKTLYFPKYIVGYSRKRSLEFISTYEGDKNVINFVAFFKELLEITENGLNYEKLLRFADKFIKAKMEIKLVGNSLYSLSSLINLEEDDDKKIDLILTLLDSLTYNDDDDDNGIVFSPINKSVTLRKYLFVVGVNQTALLGSDIENAFIQDVKKYEEELKIDENIHISHYQRLRVVENLRYYLSHSPSKIYLSFSSYDKINLKDMTEGVRLLIDKAATKAPNCYKEEVNASTSKNPLSVNKTEVEYKYDNLDTKIEINEEEKVVDEVVIEEEKKDVVFKLSPSTVSNLVQCPYMFYYDKVLRVPSLEFPELDESSWLAANTRGTLFHEIVELYFNHFLERKEDIVSFDENVFIDAFNKSLANAEMANPITNQHIYEYEKDAIKKITHTYLNKLIDENTFATYKNLANEYDLGKLDYHYEKDKKLVLHGNIDRVDGYVDNDVLHLRIVDYKSGKAKKKKEHHYYQHVLYSFVIKGGLKKLLEDNKYEFGLTYKDVVVDEFIYDFVIADTTLNYPPAEFNETSPSYLEVFKAIDEVVLLSLNGGKDIMQVMDNIFASKYHLKGNMGKFSHGPCSVCKYQKECIKCLMWGVKEWEIRK